MELRWGYVGVEDEHNRVSVNNILLMSLVFFEIAIEVCGLLWHTICVSFAIVICGCCYCVVWHDLTCTKLCTFIGCEIDAVRPILDGIVDICIHPRES